MSGTGAEGPVTFLMTDIERSSGHWERSEAEMATHLADHDRIVRGVIERHRGRLFKHTGDGAAAEFSLPADAVAAAVDLQREMVGHPLRVRVGIHTGVAQSRDGDHFGLTVTRCARVMSLGHGGQVLVSAATADLVADSPPAGVVLRDLGVHRLRGLERAERVFQADGEGLAGDFPPLQSWRAEHNLPTRRNPLIGRKQEIDQVRTLVLGHPLVTLTGIGGCGKTRLAVEAASTLLADFHDGVFFVDLSATADADLVPTDVARALELRLGSAGTIGAEVDATEEILEFLADRAALVVLDNCEHLIDACADLVDALLSRCVRARVLATSREGLEVEGEQTFRVPSLSLPEDGGAGGEAVDLFVSRAAAARSAFTLDEENSHAVREICRRLDGIPLALELAASQVAHLEPQQLLDRLDDRFRLLVGGRRRAQRQQTLQAAIDWSYNLLTPPEQRLLRVLCVFSGGFTLDAVEGVTATERGDSVRLLRSLVAKSLVVFDETAKGRYRLLESIRLYAADRLVDNGEAETARDAHRDWFLAIAESHPMDDVVFGLQVALAAEADQDNHRAALEWSRAHGDFERVARHGIRLTGLWWLLANFDEGEAWFQAVVAHESELDRLLLAWVYATGACIAMVRASGGLGERARRAAQLGGDDLKAPLIWSVLDALSDPPRAQSLVEETVAWPGITAYPNHHSIAATFAGALAWARRDFDAAADSFEAAIALAGSDGSTFAEFEARFDLFITRLIRRRYDEAGAALDGVAGAMPRDWPVDYLSDLAAGHLRAATGDPDAALEHFMAATARVRRYRIPLAIGDCAVGLGALALHRGELAAAAALIGSAGPLSPRGRVTARTPGTFSLYFHFQHRVDRALAAAGIVVDRGACLDPEDAIDAELARLGVSV